MYVRMLWGRLRRGSWAEYERLYNENAARADQTIDGFRGRQLLQSTENPDEGLSITMWDTPEALRSYGRSPVREENTRKAEHLYTGEYWIRNFEVKSSTI